MNFWAEKIFRTFLCSLFVVLILFVFILKILHYFPTIISVTNSSTVFICYLGPDDSSRGLIL